MPLESIVNVSVTKTTRTVSQVGFGTPLVYVYHNEFLDRVRSYSKSSWQSAMVTDGFSTTGSAYKTVQAVFAQNPSPKTCKVGRKSTASTKVVRITPTVSGGSGTEVHSFTIEDEDGTEYEISATEDGTPTVAELCTALASAVNATAVGVTASGASGTYVALTADVAGADFSVYSMSARLVLTEHTTTSGDSDDLAAIRTADSDWYALIPADTAPTIIEACADYAEANPIICVANTHDQGCLDSAVTTDIMSSVQDQAYARTMVLYHSRARQHAAAAWVGARLPYLPGQATWKFTTLAGVTVDAITTTQETNVLAKSGNFYSRIAGLNITTEGWAGSGEFLDVTQVSDWWVARLKEAVFGKLVGVPKLPFDQRGKSSIYGAIKNVHTQGVAQDAFVDEDPTIDIPDPEDLSDADRVTDRNWTGITTSARLTGAVHKVDSITAFLSA